MSLFSNEHVLSAGFEIDTPDKFGRTCLHAAAAGGWVVSNFSCDFLFLMTNASHWTPVVWDSKAVSLVNWVRTVSTNTKYRWVAFSRFTCVMVLPEKNFSPSHLEIVFLWFYSLFLLIFFPFRFFFLNYRCSPYRICISLVLPTLKENNLIEGIQGWVHLQTLLSLFLSLHSS